MSRRDDAALPGALAAAIAEALAPLPVAAFPREALRARILSRVAGVAADSIRTVRAAEGSWSDAGRGLSMKMLRAETHARTFLLRFAPGARLAAHLHEGDEECLVLEGACFLGGELMQRGDFQLARRGSRHGDVFSPGGCLLLVRLQA